MVAEREGRGRGRKAGYGCHKPTREICVKKTEMEESFAVALALQDRQKRMRRDEEELEPEARLWN
ncbi:MAG: hypothetical protein Q7T16_01195 [Candidatus Burarchaeum sp.]|nr:hypothetical protein [Candidatus Burarchaeum sp.]MDO8339252.1 hypothetical protein [Candidatus Burarchaeum sp.]